MEFLGYVVLFAAVLTALRAEKCIDILGCANHLHNLKKATQRGDHAALCSMQKRFERCVRNFYDDCLNHIQDINIPEAVIKQLNESLDIASTEYERRCRGFEGITTGHIETGIADTDYDSEEVSIPKNAKCMDITYCMFDIGTVMDALKSGQTRDGCRILESSMECLTTAIVDCGRTESIGQERLHQLSTMKDEIDQQYKPLCKGVSTVDHSKSKGNRRIVTRSILVLSSFCFLLFHNM